MIGKIFHNVFWGVLILGWMRVLYRMWERGFTAFAIYDLVVVVWAIIMFGILLWRSKKDCQALGIE